MRSAIVSTNSSLRAQRSNPVSLRGDSLDCFALLAMTVWQQIALHSSMKIPRRRQDANVAGVAKFLRGRIRVGAGVVIERFDQIGACRHRMLAGQGIVGKPDQVV